MGLHSTSIHNDLELVHKIRSHYTHRCIPGWPALINNQLSLGVFFSENSSLYFATDFLSRIIAAILARVNASMRCLTSVSSLVQTALNTEKITGSTFSLAELNASFQVHSSGIRMTCAAPQYWQWPVWKRDRFDVIHSHEHVQCEDQQDDQAEWRALKSIRYLALAGGSGLAPRRPAKQLEHGHGIRLALQHPLRKTENWCPGLSTWRSVSKFFPCPSGQFSDFRLATRITLRGSSSGSVSMNPSDNAFGKRSNNSCARCAAMVSKILC